jgi:choline dehydrogenase-like flavoprotein
MLATYLLDASKAGVRLVTDARVEAVTSDALGVTGVSATVGGTRLEVKARAVILAAGGLNTPAVLLRSGFGGPATGRYLRLHPATVVWGIFDDRIEPWGGSLQTRFSDQFADLDGAGYGFKFETAPLHPLFPAAFIGWDDGEAFRKDVLALAHRGLAGVLLRDRDHGRVVIRRDGTPRWRYEISRYDQAHVRVGVQRAAEALAAAGAREVLSSTVKPVRWLPGSTPLGTFVDGVDSVGYGSNRMRYFSFHQMGSARMGTDPGKSVVDASNQVHDTPGLYVMDASCFPTASGVNPMLTVTAIAHRGARLLADRLA